MSNLHILSFVLYFGAGLEINVQARTPSLIWAPDTPQVAFHRWVGTSTFLQQPPPGFAHRCFPASGASQPLWAPGMLLGIHSPTATRSPSETFHQLKTLNANLIPFSLLLMSTAKMGHFLSLPVLMLLEQKGGSLSLAWLSLSHSQLYCLVCFTHHPQIWQQSWVQDNLYLHYNGCCVFRYSGIHYMQLKQKSSKPLPAIIL